MLYIYRLIFGNHMLTKFTSDNLISVSKEGIGNLFIHDKSKMALKFRVSLIIHQQVTPSASDGQQQHS